MLTIIHTADWHIGQIFYGYERKDEHLIFFDRMKKLCREKNVDVLLIAGDIFDNPNPSAESQKIYYGFLHEITDENPGLQIIIIAGNHDSAGRLEAPNPLLENMNITVKGFVKRTTDGEIDYADLIIPLKKDDKIEALCIAAPYLRQGDYPTATNYADSIALMYENLYSEARKMYNSDTPIIAMGHLQARSAYISDGDTSERTIIGGIESVSSEVFTDETHYVALGHLHRHQHVAGRNNIQYAGAPLPMSFAEKNYKQGVNLIVLNGNKPAEIERIAFDPPVKLLSIPSEPKPLDEVLSEIMQLPDGDITFNSPYLEVKIMITDTDTSIRYKIEESLKNKSVKLASTSLVRNLSENEEDTSHLIRGNDLKTMNPVDIAENVYYNNFKKEMPENLKNLMMQVIESIN